MDWLTNTRTSYDAVATGYAAQMRDSLTDKPYVRGMVTLFADLVRGAGDGPVADVGCGTGHVTAFLRDLGVEAFGIDLSPGMIEVARRDHPGVRFEVGSMTDLPLADASVAGLLAWWSLIHVPDDEVPVALAHFRRAVRPGGVVMLGFHEGNGTTHKTNGYGGNPMDVYIHRRPPARMAAWLNQAGFTVEARVTIDPSGRVPGAVLFAR
ncbi:MAG: class I SAM-dependent methyltransferase [Actinomycetota bacterium]|nr:class I SAM-dependent methyltransferase [Actinomycetota bacterium]